MFPQIPLPVVHRKVTRWYKKLVLAGIVDTLNASHRYAVARNYLTQKRRLELSDEKIKIGRRIYYVMPLSDIPKRARKHLKEGWPIIEFVPYQEAIQ